MARISKRVSLNPGKKTMSVNQQADLELPTSSPTNSAAHVQQVRKAARSTETVHLLTLEKSNERIEALELQARELALVVEATRQQSLIESERKIEALRQTARELADFVETLRHQTRIQSEAEVAALGQKAHDLAVSVESVREATFQESQEKSKSLEEQFRQSQKMDAVGQLAAGVAHDFNNLLTVIVGYSALLLLKLPATDPSRESLGQIRKAGERAANLTRQLLAFGRKQIMAPVVLNLNSLVTELEKMLRRLIGEDILFNTHLDPAIAPIKVDSGQLEQVIMNLAVNARDAMPQGGQITVETTMVEWDHDYCRLNADCKPGKFVKLSITDTGSGMTPEVKARIFEPFFTTKEPGKGTGLGLSTVFGIIKQSDGYINVYSEVGHGTSFSIYLPAIAAKASASTSNRSLESILPGTETILLVEDEQGVREIARIVLASYGYTVLEAKNGQEALAIVDRHKGPIHMCITDVVMPEMSGRQLAETLRTKRPGFRVMFMSGYTDDAVVRNGIIQAEEIFLQKPFTPTALAKKVREVLDEKNKAGVSGN